MNKPSEMPQQVGQIKTTYETVKSQTSAEPLVAAALTLCFYVARLGDEVHQLRGEIGKAAQRRG